MICKWRSSCFAFVGMLLLTACAQGVSSETTQFCEDFATADAILNEGPPEDDPAAWQEETVAALEGLKISAPDAVEPAIAALADGLIGPINSMDEKAYFEFADSEAFQIANSSIDQFMTAECGWPVNFVIAREYEFDGDLNGFQAGRMGIALENLGAEAHHMVLFRFNDGVSETVEELLAMPEDGVEGMVSDVGYAQALPGITDTSFVTLTAGRYGMVCFIPTGATSWEEAATLESPPHFTEGMLREFTVSG